MLPVPLPFHRIKTERTRVGICGFVLGCKHIGAGGGVQLRAAATTPPDIMTDYATWLGESPRLTVPCYLSFRSALETRDRRAFRESTAASLCIPFHSGYWFKYETCTPQEKQTNTDFSFFLFYIFFPPFRPKFKRAAGFCRLGSYSGRNTRPSSYSPSCPSLTKLSPSVTSSSDRRRPLGLCQNWVMCECWTGMREKNKTLHTEGQKSKGSTFNESLRVRFYFWGRTCQDSVRDEQKGKKRTERNRVVVSTQVKTQEERNDWNKGKGM